MSTRRFVTGQYGVIVPAHAQGIIAADFPSVISRSRSQASALLLCVLRIVI
jgi:hypothetical protein